MPIYEYECDACGHHMEALQKFSDSPLGECEACRSSRIKRVMSQSTFHLKGSGWYVTDYASKSGSTHSRGKEKGPDGGGKAEVASSADSKNKKDASAPSNTKEKAV